YCLTTPGAGGGGGRGASPPPPGPFEGPPSRPPVGFFFRGKPPPPPPPPPPRTPREPTPRTFKKRALCRRRMVPSPDDASPSCRLWGERVDNGPFRAL